MRAADHPLQVWDPLAVGNQAPHTFINDRLCVHQAFGHVYIVVHFDLLLHIPSSFSSVPGVLIDQHLDHP